MQFPTPYQLVCLTNPYTNTGYQPGGAFPKLPHTL